MFLFLSHFCFLYEVNLLYSTVDIFWFRFVRCSSSNKIYIYLIFSDKNKMAHFWENFYFTVLFHNLILFSLIKLFINPNWLYKCYIKRFCNFCNIVTFLFTKSAQFDTRKYNFDISYCLSRTQVATLAVFNNSQKMTSAQTQNKAFSSSTEYVTEQ